MGTIADLLADAHASWDDGTRLAWVGIELQNRNRLDQARRVLRRALDLAPEREDAWAHLAYAWLRSGGDAQGRAVLREGVDRTGSDLLRATLSGFTDDEREAEALRAAVGASPRPSVQANLLFQRFRRGEHEPALTALRALHRAHPGDGEVRESLLWALLGARGRNLLPGIDLRQEALDLADGMARDDPASVNGPTTRLMVLEAEKDWDAVLAETGRALERFPDEETVMLIRARAHREKGDLDRAIAWCCRAIGAKPSFAGARVELGKLYERHGKHDLAEEVFREIPVAHPAYKAGPLSLALFLARRGRFEEAERTLLAAWPDLPEPWRQGFRANPDAQALLAREAVRRVVG